MKKLATKTLLFILLLVTGTAGYAQQYFFSDAPEAAFKSATQKRVTIPSRYRTVSLDKKALLNFLNTVPTENTAGKKNNKAVLEIPMPKGDTAKFYIWESSAMAPELAAQYPDIKTYSGQGITDGTATIKIDWTEFGFHAMILSPVSGSVFIDPYAQGNISEYIVYFKEDLKKNDLYIELPPRTIGTNANRPVNPENILAGSCRGTQLYVYRLAVACTHQYAVAATGLSNPTVAQTLAKIVTTVNRVNGVYEKEVSVRIVLVRTENKVIFTDALSDPFSGNNDPFTLINESQSIIDSKIGNSNYDIGHTFSTGGGGLADVGVICNSTFKGEGITGTANPTGDGYDIDYVAHEMGHQFGANHTFNSVSGSCGGGNRNSSTAYEPGSGTTIMAYAGICTTDDIQPHSDPFFHAISFDEINNYLQSDGGGCASIIETGNTLPQITAMNNKGVSIPLRTPFTLTAKATDANGDSLTYSWEEWDLGTEGAWNSGANNSTAPLFKCRLPKTTGSRTFPDMAVILAGYPPHPDSSMSGLKGETLPAVARSVKFRLTVRDNRGGVVSGGNGCQSGFTSTFKINAVAGTGPFLVTAPNGGETWGAGSTQTITWNTAGTSAAPISCNAVNILLSTDGGNTYPDTLLVNTPNDGSQKVVMPATATNTARIMIRAANNIFFDISNNNFKIADTLIINKAPVVHITSPANNAVYTAPANITLSAAASDSNGTISYVKFYNAGTLLGTDSTSPYTFAMNGIAAGNYSFVAKAAGNDGLLTSSASVAVTVSAARNKAPVVQIISPANNAAYTAPASIVVNASASDSDGTISYVSFYNNGILLNTDSTSPYTCTLNNVAAGNYSLVAKATDNNGLTTSSASVGIALSAPKNNAPVVSITSPANNGVYIPGTIVIKANASDADGTISNVKFYSGSKLLTTDSISPYSCTLSNLSPGTYTYVTKATDNKGLSGSSSSVTITILDSLNIAPVVNIVSPVNNSISYAHTAISLDAIATDADSISYVTFYSGSTLLKTDSTSPYNYILYNAAPGNYSFTASATDKKGLFSSSPSVDVTVLQNKAPVVNIFTDDSVYTAPATVIINAAASDSDGTIHYVQFYNGTTLLKTDSTSTGFYSFSWNNVPAGSYSLTAKATDNHGATTTSGVVHITVTAGGTLEAEQAVLNGAVIASSVPGFTGSGYADYVHASGDFIEWTVNAPAAGPFLLKFRYGNGGTTNRPLQLQINGVVINAGVDFLPTGGWAVWSISSITANLITGINKIRLTTTGFNGPNVDNLTPIANAGTLEAEEAVLNGAVVASSVPGFTGSGYADYINASGDFIEWTLNAADSGSFLLSFRYGNGGTADRPLQLQVNGVVVNAGLTFSPTGGWAVWALSSTTARLIAGINKIRLTTTGFNGPNMDNLAFSYNNSLKLVQKFVTGKNVLKSPGVLSAWVSPNPVAGNAKLVLSASSDLPVNLQLVDMLGRIYKSIKFLYRGSDIFDFSVSDLAPGSYIIIVKQGNVRTHARLIIAKK